MAKRGKRSVRVVVWLFRICSVIVGVGSAILLIHFHNSIIEAHIRMARSSQLDDFYKRSENLMEYVAAELAELLAGEEDPAALKEAAARAALRKKLLILNKLGDISNMVIVSPDGKIVASLTSEGKYDLVECAIQYGALRGTRRHGFHGEGRAREMCLSFPIRIERQVVGAAVIHKPANPAEFDFGVIQRQMLKAIVAGLLLLYILLASIVYMAQREVWAIEREKEESDRLASLGNLAAGVAHEIRNPLNTIALTCQYVQRLLQREEVPQALDQELSSNFDLVTVELERLRGIINNFIRLARPPELKLRPVNMDTLLSDTLALFQQELQQKGIELRMVAGHSRDGQVQADPDSLKQVFTNIVKNAVEAMPEGGSLFVRSEQLRSSFRVSFTDTGPGLGQDVVGHVFEPYFTTKPDGLGLGLALSHGIVSSHGGKIQARSHPGKGSTFTVELPV